MSFWRSWLRQQHEEPTVFNCRFRKSSSAQEEMHIFGKLRSCWSLKRWKATCGFDMLSAKIDSCGFETPAASVNEKQWPRGLLSESFSSHPFSQERRWEPGVSGFIVVAPPCWLPSAPQSSSSRSTLPVLGRPSSSVAPTCRRVGGRCV